jgi:hypothetical protein
MGNFQSQDLQVESFGPCKIKSPLKVSKRFEKEVKVYCSEKKRKKKAGKRHMKFNNLYFSDRRYPLKIADGFFSTAKS